jgi:hypothetical protein
MVRIVISVFTISPIKVQAVAVRPAPCAAPWPHGTVTEYVVGTVRASA